MAHQANVTFIHQDKSSRLWALLTIFGIKGLLLIPHMVVLFVLQIVAMLGMIVGVFAVLFTGKYPLAIEEFVVGITRWQWRMMAYFLCLTDKYPPFSLKKANYPAEFSFQHQEKSSRLMAVLTLIPIKYFMLIPHMFVMMVLGFLAEISMFLGIFVTLFTGKYPKMFEKIIRSFMNYSVRIQLYFMCLTDKYPSISWKA